jgi:hypothetical protein
MRQNGQGFKQSKRISYEQFASPDPATNSKTGKAYIEERYKEKSIALGAFQGLYTGLVEQVLALPTHNPEALLKAVKELQDQLPESLDEKSMRQWEHELIMQFKSQNHF